MSRFAEVPAAPPVEIFALSKAYKEDTFPNKVDLGIGAYRTNEGKPWILPVVRQAELAIAADDSLNHEYLGQLGDEKFSKLATETLLGADSVAIKEGRAFGIQALSGTGALRIGADFLRRCAGFKTVYISDPSWRTVDHHFKYIKIINNRVFVTANHKLLFNHANYPEIKFYRYWDANNLKLDFDGLIEDLQNAPEDSVVILHCCAHNPTGIDPTNEQWEQIANVMQERKLFPFFDIAYQGFASGDLERDSYAIRYFVSRGFELLGAQSFAKNFGLYNERIGNLTVVVNDKSTIANIKGQITLLVRGNYSNPPAHGSRIVSKILSDNKLHEEWKHNIKLMSTRIIDMRNALRNKLEELGTPGKWDHITTQIGMFSYTGLNQKQVQYLVQEHHVYLPKDGRISICGINTNNVEYVAKAIHDAVTKFPNA
ncbi:aspartate aminotransferase: cytoplasmic-like protein [Dinothrombium tinctorium]|uniref:Aspartate aminotransferase n=1 Tax=Dinothrombium tinctorium TaxID=1965070 RepID=A0A443QDB6_9ACAR|nr:aspartate aminotransferase: cytoplasmic-like protein [Dinothrombium tinctorium]